MEHLPGTSSERATATPVPVFLFSYLMMKQEPPGSSSTLTARLCVDSTATPSMLTHLLGNCELFCSYVQPYRIKAHSRQISRNPIESTATMRAVDMPRILHVCIAFISAQFGRFHIISSMQAYQEFASTPARKHTPIYACCILLLHTLHNQHLLLLVETRCLDTTAVDEFNIVIPVPLRFI